MKEAHHVLDWTGIGPNVINRLLLLMIILKQKHRSELFWEADAELLNFS
jgi:hypothetical protein